MKYPNLQGGNKRMNCSQKFLTGDVLDKEAVTRTLRRQISRIIYIKRAALKI